jgi:hypothetical protein
MPMVVVLIVAFLLIGWLNALQVWEPLHTNCVEVTVPNRVKADHRARLEADAWHDSWISKRNLVRLDRAEGQQKVADENADLARKLHRVELGLRVPLKNPSCDDSFPRPKFLGVF